MYWALWTGFCIGKCIAGCLLLLLSFSFTALKNWPQKSWTTLFTIPFTNRFREWAHFIYFPFTNRLSTLWTVYRSIRLYESTCVCIYLLLCIYIYMAASLSLSPKYESFRQHIPSPILNKNHGFCTSTNQETNSKCGKRPMGVSQSTFFHIHHR